MSDSSAPSTASVAVAVGLIALTAGYFLGQGSNIGLFGSSGNPSKSPGTKKSWPNSYDVTIHPDSSDEELMAQQRAGAGAQAEESDSDDDGDEKELKSFANTAEDVKLVLAVRTDLGMGKGTI
jgi:peptidyl-tRNA hydrolase, PTH2 family